MFTYTHVSLHRVVDGDTVILTIDLGFDVFLHETVRLESIDAPERFTAAGPKTTERLKALLANGILRLETSSFDKYHRAVGQLWIPGEPRSVSQVLLDEGLARPYVPGK